MSQKIQRFQQQLINNLHTAVQLIDDAFALDYDNPAEEVLFSMSLDRLLGKHVFKFVQCE